MLRLLAPLTPIYVTRTSPDGQRVHVVAPCEPQPIRSDGFEPCLVEAIVTVDAKGRVPLPAKDRQTAADVASAIVVEDRMIDVRFADRSSEGRSAIDPRGRLQLHHGVLRAARLAPGDRLAIVRFADPLRVILTCPANLAVRRAAS